ncbi:unnamed protein product [Brassica napus]|uniref:(rape) hypothetical protein n=1 Tax=Brassica napus TaxID=3708 RepID=A0A816X8X5_BRANA|nr:unnamed protein product [Brassica napus]
MSLDVPGSPHTYWGRFLGVPETSPSPRRIRYVRRHQLGVPVQPRFSYNCIITIITNENHIVLPFWAIQGKSGQSEI